MSLLIATGTIVFLMDFLKLTEASTNASNTFFKSNIDQLIDMTYPYAVFRIELAVKAIAETVKDLYNKRKSNINLKRYAHKHTYVYYVR